MGTINDEFKNICQKEYFRHRSFTNFSINLLTRLTAYSFLSKKSEIKYQNIESNLLALFY